jgi:hypothetical protein
VDDKLQQSGLVAAIFALPGLFSLPQGAKDKDTQRSARRPGTSKDLHPPLTRLAQSGSGYEHHLILSLSNNRVASVLGSDLASYRLTRGPVVHVFHPSFHLCPFIPVVNVLSAQGSNGRSCWPT